MKKSVCFILTLAAAMAAASAASAQFGPPNPDPNRDGRVTLPEFKAVSSTQVLQRLDSNKDGSLARAEYQTAIDLISRFAGADVGKRAARRFAEDDSNQDGQLSRAEMELAAQRRFAKADSNGDGSLDKAELKASRQPARDDARD
jgi:opacity protein-like surface antigen